MTATRSSSSLASATFPVVLGVAIVGAFDVDARVQRSARRRFRHAGRLPHPTAFRLTDNRARAGTGAPGPHAPGVLTFGNLVDKVYRLPVTAAAGGCSVATDAEHYLQEGQAMKAVTDATFNNEVLMSDRMERPLPHA
jgi:hypothetical protein